MKKYRAYMHTSFKGVCPVGTAAIVVARDRRHAKKLLEVELERLGLEQDDPIDMADFELVKADVPRAEVLLDGSY